MRLLTSVFRLQIHSYGSLSISLSRVASYLSMHLVIQLHNIVRYDANVMKQWKTLRHWWSLYNYIYIYACVRCPCMCMRARYIRNNNSGKWIWLIYIHCVFPGFFSPNHVHVVLLSIIKIYIHLLTFYCAESKMFSSALHETIQSFQ